LFGGASKARGERSRLKSRYWLSWGLSVIAIGSIATGALVLNRALAVCTIWLAAVFGWRIRSLENKLQVKIDLADSLSREINHRVGYHLQLVASVLRLQAADSCSEASRRVLELAGSRLRTIGRINRKLAIDSPTLKDCKESNGQ
jgi:two-component sensor histidine kinase